MKAWLRGVVLSAICAAACRSETVPNPAAQRLASEMLAGEISRPGLAYGIVYRLYAPKRASPATPAPLIVFLHSSGANGTDNLMQLGASDVGQLLERAQRHEPAFVLAPQCPLGDKWITREEHWPHVNYEQATRPESDALRLVLLLVDELVQQLPIDRDRIYLVGASAGAAGTWDAITRHDNHPFAAAIAMTGIGDPSRAPVIATMPIWVFHGAKDDGSPVTNSRGMVEALRRLGSPVRYTEYADLGHNSWDRAFAEEELFSWLFAQRKSQWRPRP